VPGGAAIFRRARLVQLRLLRVGAGLVLVEAEIEAERVNRARPAVGRGDRDQLFWPNPVGCGVPFFIGRTSAPVRTVRAGVMRLLHSSLADGEDLWDG
jgi:hypothetical protein